MAFIQKVRLPIMLTQPNFPLEATSFRLANGDVKNMSSVIRKVYKLKTDWMPERWHESLRIALAHDFVQIESSKFIGGIAMEGTAYEIDWNDYMDYPQAKAEAQVQVDLYDFSNSSCVSCEAANQLDLTDDNFGTVVQGGFGGGNVLANDSVFCDPVTVSIVSYNLTYLAPTPTITNQGVLSFQVHNPVYSATSVKILTYRVTCPDGSYDEADVYINVDGLAGGCSAPDNVRDANPPTHTSHQVVWDNNGVPADGWYWELYRADNLGQVVLSGSVPQIFPTAGAVMSGLEPCTDYRLFVRSVCQTGVNESAYAELTFSTDCFDAICGRYEVGFDNGTADRVFTSFTFLNCAGSYQTINVPNMQSRIVCMQQNSPGNPTDINGGFTSLEYIEICG